MIYEASNSGDVQSEELQMLRQTVSVLNEKMERLSAVSLPPGREYHHSTTAITSDNSVMPIYKTLLTYTYGQISDYKIYQRLQSFKLDQGSAACFS